MNKNPHRGEGDFLVLPASSWGALCTHKGTVVVVTMDAVAMETVTMGQNHGNPN